MCVCFQGHHLPGAPGRSALVMQYQVSQRLRATQVSDLQAVSTMQVAQW